MTEDELKTLRDMEFKDVQMEELVEADSISFDENMPVEARIRKVLETVQNPYFRKVGETKVKISFSNNGQSFRENYLGMLASV
jgi:hypothetical protein